MAALASRLALAYRPGLGIPRLDRPGQASVNSYLLIGERSVVIVDCQRTAVEARTVVAAARGTCLPVEAIVLTHEYADHIVGLDIVARAFLDAPILDGEVTRDWIVREGYGLLEMMRPVVGPAIHDRIPEPTRIMRPNQVIRLAGNDWHIDQLGPGEASGMTLLHTEAEDILIAGDLFGSRSTPWLLDGHMRDWVRQLDAAEARYGGVGTSLPGHGAAAPAGGLIREQRAYLRYIEDLVRAALADDGRLPEEALPAIRAAMDARFPDYPRVAPQPDLIDRNARALAIEIGSP
ncbi:MAG: hypothetical protein RLY86_1883 [Pseudomonadota bacterium]|jgi:glyoxylase-like metal-dependent hydrolase (beta-lactamase superfamily II)